MARSGFANNRTMTGVSFELYSSSDNLAPIFMTEANTFGPPPPNSTDLSSSGSTLALKYSSGNPLATSSSSLGRFLALVVFRSNCAHLRNSSRSPSLLRPRLSIPSDNFIKGVSKKPPFRLPCSLK